MNIKMEYTKEDFPEMEAKNSKGLTLAFRIFGYSLPVIISICCITILVIIFSSDDSEKIPIIVKISLSLLTILLLWFFGWLFMQEKKKSRNKVTRITVDCRGLHHYINENVMKSLLFSSLQSNYQDGEYDIMLSVPQGESDHPYHILFFTLNNDLNVVQETAFLLDADFIITNGNQLKKHFLKGLMIFRPDLRIDPGILKIYG